MTVYRITKEEFADQLMSSGRANRWNKNEQHVIYASGSISLCALELLAHSAGIKPAGTYCIMHIKIEPAAGITNVSSESLPVNWQELSSYPYTQQLGSSWYESKQSLLLKIPSAIISQENNFILNKTHPDFESKVQHLDTTDFIWDHRFPEN
ncbi:MAG: RES family NAD+ phosphorylase [Reichenbachiella sp.]|uniref:RES family NAD+ phosphorylase n=1 Tax=Reichenbachiella sp. TaxID=2184521 RepID=UPI003266DF9F